MTHQHWILIACLGLVPACSDDEPTDTPDNDLAGTTPLDLGTGVNTFWIDTDGVDPEVAGCHIEFGDVSCDFVSATARNFGEFCQEDGTLVESNPDAAECHTHINDIGHPYVVDCVAWCQGTLILPNGLQRGVSSATGSCEPVLALPCDTGIVDSARCVCE